MFEYALDGDTNGDYININTESAKRNAINTLLQHLDKKLMGGEMPSEYYTAITTHLMNMNWGKTKNFSVRLSRENEGSPFSGAPLT